MTDNWAEKHWLNVPGPFCTGQTDTCWTGRQVAARHVLCGGEFQNEFIYRQPKTPDEVQNGWQAGEDDPWDGYGRDGDERWTPDTVRAWWNDRAKVEEHITGLIAEWAASGDSEELDAAEGGRDFLAYLAGDLENDLRAYLFRLEQGRYPHSGEQLPQL